MSTKYEEDQRLAMYHLEQMCGSIFRITKRDGVEVGRRDLREIRGTGQRDWPIHRRTHGSDGREGRLRSSGGERDHKT